MADTHVTAPDLSVLIQVQHRVPAGARKSLHDTGNSPVGSNSTGKTHNESDTDKVSSRVQETANKFEALLIHNMLKSMRKTTMAENTSNQKALYDDMLDERLAETMMQAGGLGVARQLISELQGIRQPQQSASISPADRSKLRELAFGSDDAKPLVRDNASSATVGSDRPVATTSSAANRSMGSTTDIASLRMASGLWGREGDREKSRAQLNFLQPLLPHAIRSAERLGTTPTAVLAVAALETGWGRAMLKNHAGQSAHNYFGIKATSTDQTYTSNITTEFVNGKPQKTVAHFKTFESPADAMEGFADFLLTNPRYSTALQKADNPEQFLRELHVAGYATDPNYADKAISVLHQIDRHLSPL